MLVTVIDFFNDAGTTGLYWKFIKSLL